ncbi:MAG: hypothetical protein WCX48_08525 [Bacteroidales bacterium]
MAHLITASEVITIAFIGEEKISSDKIKDVSIDIAEKEFIIPHIGQDLYDALILGSYTELATLLEKPLAFYVRFLILPEIAVSVANMGLMQSINDYSRPVSSAMQNTLLQRTLKNAETLMDTVVKYIQDNYELYPEYIYKRHHKIIGGIIL